MPMKAERRAQAASHPLRTHSGLAESQSSNQNSERPARHDIILSHLTAPSCSRRSGALAVLEVTLSNQVLEILVVVLAEKIDHFRID
jgi:hypothetical protein